MRNYWLDLFSPASWNEFLQAGASVSGFAESRWKTVQKFQIGDYLLAYLTGISRWVGILEVTSGPFKETSRIWTDEVFPCRVQVKVVAKLTPETAVPVLDMKNELSVFHNLKNPLAWTGHFRGSPARWNTSDGEAVTKAILEAEKHPINRPIDPTKLKYRAKAFRAKIGLVTVPGSEPSTEQQGQVEDVKEPTVHTEIQSILLNLGSDMGYDVWVARNDRNRSFNGQRFADLPRMKKSLPLQFDDATNKTIELIDVLWLTKNAIVAAFEIESTTVVYSGLLRMADLIAMHPNLNIPLYASGSRRAA